VPRKTTRNPQDPRFFPTPADFRAWLERHHQTHDELLVGFYKRHCGRPSITWPESVDEALSFGWIDGVRRRIDDESYTIRFSPRRQRSIWSTINIRRVAELTKLGRMRQAGLAAFERRLANKSGIYGYEQRYHAVLEHGHVKQFKKTPAAWTFFRAQPPSYQRTLTFWITSAKREETKMKRLKRLIATSAAGKRVI